MRPPAPRSPRGAAPGRWLATAAEWSAHAAGAAARWLWSAGRRSARRAWQQRRVREGCALAVFALAVAAASVQVRDAVRADVRYRVSKASLAATRPPAGLTRHAVAQLASLPFPGRSFSLYDPRCVPQIVRTYAALPWVRTVRRVQLDFPSRLRFDLQVRRPVAALRHGERTLLLDEDAMVLPAACYAPNDPAALRLPLLEGADLGRRRLIEGRRIASAAIRHGLAVAVALRARRFDALWAHTVRIDVSNVDGRLDPRKPEIVVTAGRTRIEWGRSPASDKLQIPVEQKLERLETVLHKDPGLRRLALVRLQFDWLETRPAPPEPAAR
ncbi:MAG: hypothetical protein D6776_08905 [Planctomycetota bacterium]|nr:MAG: hypothetical protein D6776_08905 [Planctomycetota bacterium]